MRSALQADVIILNTAVAGKWIDSALHDDLDHILPKVLWWIHEMRGHYFSYDLVKHLPKVAGVIIDSHATAEYWRNRTAVELRSVVISTLPQHEMHLQHLYMLRHVEGHRACLLFH